MTQLTPEDAVKHEQYEQEATKRLDTNSDIRLVLQAVRRMLKEQPDTTFSGLTGRCLEGEWRCLLAGAFTELNLLDDAKEELYKLIEILNRGPKNLFEYQSLKAHVSPRAAAFGDEMVKAVKSAGIESCVNEEREQDTPPAVTLVFNVAAGHMPELQNLSGLFIVGNIPQLGSWTIKDGLELKRSVEEGDEDIWSGTIKLDPSLAGKVEYKDGTEHWERSGGSNRLWTGEERLEIAWEP